jgi:hypothetical protein
MSGIYLSETQKYLIPIIESWPICRCVSNLNFLADRIIRYYDCIFIVLKLNLLVLQKLLIFSCKIAIFYEI